MNEEYAEIDLIELFYTVLRHWWLIILLTVIAAGLSYYITTERITPVYQASSTLFIGKESNSLTDFSFMNLESDQQLVTDYSELIRTHLITRQVISELALLATADDISANLGVEPIGDSRFMHITFQDPDPEIATIITNKLSEIITEKAVDIVGVQNIMMVDQAEIPINPISPSTTKNVAIAGVLGFMVALFVIFVKMLMVNTVQKEEDIEKLLGVPVLGVISKFKGEERI